MQDTTVADAALESNIETGNADNNQYDAYIQETGDKHKVDPNLIHSIIKMESNYNAGTKSHAGAAGLMQLIPDTANSLGVSGISDAKQNIDAGVRYFKNMLKEHNGDIPIALAAYNAGPGNVKKHDGIPPPFQETEQYVHKVMDHYNTLST
ncbi:MAG TPA: lytic transglycosylase domain-containing protein [Pseudogracilibacillus sp.]|nr:lytic transglycosylase domain-containing protein [Pseudogracilibacillus sp.]